MRKFAIFSLFIGITVLLYGIWIPVKAQVAQILLSQAWDSSIKDDKFEKPWPWADVKAVGRLVIPKQSLDQVILSGMSGQSLAFGPGHNSSTAYPGDTGLVMLSGHRDTHFKALEHVITGDTIELHGRSKHMLYKVMDSFVIDIRADSLQNSAEDILLLVTCYPFGAMLPSTPFRYVISAKAVGRE